MEDESQEIEEPKSPRGQPLTPVLVEYCRNCSMPYDYCDFGDKWETGVCYKECTSRYPDVYPVESMSFDDLSITAIPSKNKKNAIKEVPMVIHIQKTSRTKRKVITSVTGLNLFDVKLESATKLFSKQFATGATVIKGTNGQPDRIDIQGDVEDALVDLLISNYSGITEDKIVRMQPKIK